MNDPKVNERKILHVGAVTREECALCERRAGLEDGEGL